MPLGRSLSHRDLTGQNAVILTRGSSHKTIESVLGKNVWIEHGQGAGF